MDMDVVPYTLRYSDRAKRCSLRLKATGTIEVVLPRGTPPHKAAELVHQHRDWIQRKQTHLQTLRQETLGRSVDSSSSPALPHQLELRSCHQIWQVHYEPTSDSGIRITQSSPLHLTLSGQCGLIALGAKALRQWLQHHGRSILLPWLAQVSEETGLTYHSAGIRNQKTRWGSCSSRQTISLNAQLLFLPPELVRYVLIHELCHTVHLDHSSHFWALVAQQDVQYRSLDRTLSKAWAYVPPWYGF